MHHSIPVPFLFNSQVALATSTEADDGEHGSAAALVH